MRFFWIGIGMILCLVVQKLWAWSGKVIDWLLERIGEPVEAQELELHLNNPGA